MIKRILHSIIWLGIITWMFLITGFVGKAREKVPCKRLEINISDSADVSFVTSAFVREMIAGTGMNILGNPVDDIQTRDLESVIEKNPYVACAEAYVTVDGLLRIDIEQRKPLLRIMPGGQGGYYVDQGGYILPLSETFTPMVLLVTGYMDFPVLRISDEDSRLDTTRKEVSNLLAFARYVHSSGFWNKQIVQVYRSRDGEYELIPRVGAHQISFGTMEGYRTKLRNLKLLYEQGFSAYGWNTYDKINLKYSNQIICTKR